MSHFYKFQWKEKMLLCKNHKPRYIFSVTFKMIISLSVIWQYIALTSLLYNSIKYTMEFQSYRTIYQCPLYKGNASRKCMIRMSEIIEMANFWDMKIKTTFYVFPPKCFSKWINYLFDETRWNNNICSSLNDKIVLCKLLTILNG